MIHAHERTKPGHKRKFEVPEASEVAALIVGEQYGALDLVLPRKESLNAVDMRKWKQFDWEIACTIHFVAR